MAYEVEKGVPVPRARTTWSKYPFADMAVGDSFQVEPGYPYLAAVGAARRFGKSHPPKKFACRKLENGEHRIWRVE